MPTRLPPSLDKETNDCYTRLVCSKRAPGELLLLLLPPLSSGSSSRGCARCLQLQRTPRRALPTLSDNAHERKREREREREKKKKRMCVSFVVEWMGPMSRSGGSRCRCYHLSQKLIRRRCAEPREFAPWNMLTRPV